MITGSCKEAHRLVARSLDRPLPVLQRTRLRLHLAACDACRAFKGQMLWLTRAMRHLDRD
jgi:hypothetical protein